MENTKKIALIIIYFLFLTGCNSQKKDGLHLPNNLFKNDNGDIIFKVNNHERVTKKKGMTIINDSINFSHVFDIDSKEYKEIKNVIDVKSFRNIFNNPENEKKVYFDDQSVLWYECYYEDKNSLYIYPTNGTDFLMIKNKNYEVLGGAYLKINNQIYYLGYLVPSADIETFKTIRLRNGVDFYRESIGMDKNHLYSGSSIMTYDFFKDNYSSYKELKEKYFKTK